MRIVIGAAIVIAMVVLCYFLFAESSSSDAVRIHELEQQVSDLKAQLAESHARPARSQSVESQPVSPGQSLTVSATPDLKERMQELTKLVERFEQTSRDLNDRITRSKLNLPTREELRVQTDKARVELDKARSTARRTLAMARQRASSAARRRRSCLDSSHRSSRCNLRQLATRSGDRLPSRSARITSHPGSERCWQSRKRHWEASSAISGKD